MALQGQKKNQKQSGQDKRNGGAAVAEYEPCSSCGGKVIDGKPHYIPLGTDTVLEIIDQQCENCGCAIIGPHQKTRTIKNQKAHDRLIEFFEKEFRKGGTDHGKQ